MTQDDLTKLAKAAGFLVDGDSWIHAGAVLIDGRKSIDEQLKRFAALVAAHKAEVALAEAYRCGVEAGAAAEREGVAQMFEASPELVRFAQNDQGGCVICGLNPKTEAKAIRARGNT